MYAPWVNGGAMGGWGFTAEARPPFPRRPVHSSQRDHSEFGANESGFSNLTRRRRETSGG